MIFVPSLTGPPLNGQPFCTSWPVLTICWCALAANAAESFSKAPAQLPQQKYTLPPAKATLFSGLQPLPETGHLASLGSLTAADTAPAEQTMATHRTEAMRAMRLVMTNPFSR